MSDYRDLLSPETRARLIAFGAVISPKDLDAKLAKLDGVISRVKSEEDAKRAEIVALENQRRDLEPVRDWIVQEIAEFERVHPLEPVNAKPKAATYSGDFTWDDIRISTMRNTGNFRCDSSV